MHAITFPFVDADRKNPSRGPGNGKHISMRARFAVAIAIAFAVWLFFRLNDYFVR